MSKPQISMQLEVMANGKVSVPGREPTSAISSLALSMYLANDRGPAQVSFQAILDAIPGSYLKYGTNFNIGGARQRWVVLPPKEAGCPCPENVDYYEIIRNLPPEEEEITEVTDACSTLGMGYCPSPDFDSVPEPPQSPYQQEGDFPAGVGYLPPVPPWALD